MANTANDTINAWLAKLNAALQENDSQQAAELFAEESYWRDFVSFTWNLKTMEGRAVCRFHKANRLLLKLTGIGLTYSFLFHHLDTPWATLSPNISIR